MSSNILSAKAFCFGISEEVSLTFKACVTAGKSLASSVSKSIWTVFLTSGLALLEAQTPSMTNMHKRCWQIIISTAGLSNSKGCLMIMEFGFLESSPDI
jgi:hypothetical protein